MKSHLFRLGHYRAGSSYELGTEEEFQHADRYEMESMRSGGSRLQIGAKLPLSVVLQLVEVIEPPYDLLYVLHTSRCDSELGRYQSPPVDKSQLRQFLQKFSSFLSQDGRHDFWLHSVRTTSTVVLDRHDLIFAYGPLEIFEDILLKSGLSKGEVKVPFPHTHHYHPQFDSAEKEILAYFPWNRTPLQPSDEQYRVD